jgi:glycerol-3-phosphate acyltransferase PlsX
MGGDHAPAQVVLGAAQAAQVLGHGVSVVGQPAKIQPLLEPHPALRFVPASQVIGMDEPAAQAVRARPDSSMSVCARMCKEGHADAWVSAGNSGAVVAAALLIQGRIRGVERPALGTILPSAERPCYFVDVGANVDSKPEYLVQSAKMASVFAAHILQRVSPRIALLSNGEEEGKGDRLVRDVSQRLGREKLNFVGNVEPKELLQGKADVVVADGFVGNITIKTAEATADLILRSIREEVPRTLRGKLGGLLVRSSVSRVRSRLDWREYGGAPLLGIDGVAVVAHGRSDARAIRNAIRVAAQAVEVGLVDKVKAAVGR